MRKVAEHLSSGYLVRREGVIDYCFKLGWQGEEFRRQIGALCGCLIWPSFEVEYEVRVPSVYERHATTAFNL